jgi:hypothetical protein
MSNTALVSYNKTIASGELCKGIACIYEKSFGVTIPIEKSGMTGTSEFFKSIVDWQEVT